MEFKCCKCGGGIEMGRSFEPIDPKGTENRRWICNVCQGTERKTLNDVLFNETRSEKEQKAKIEMVEYEGDYVPKELCSIDALGGVDDVVPCSGTCEQEECDTCIVTKVFNEYARLTNQIKDTKVESNE
nr:MAG TPA: zinc-ribbon domain protein [Caudoviricetes sp.]